MNTKNHINYKEFIFIKNMNISETLIPFGKYKNSSLFLLLRDRKYCNWLIKQTWFAERYEFLYNRVLNYNPSSFFFKDIQTANSFVKDFCYFNLLSLDKIVLPLTDIEKECYSFYLECIEELKNQIIDKQSYNIKAPVKWLQKLEQKTSVNRQEFKEFLSAHDLLNIPSIVEIIKKQGGVDYKGAKSFIIAKENSIKQEEYWEKILKEKYGEEIAFQYNYRNCIFDAICISKKRVFECKIGLKDFIQEQYDRYMSVLSDFNMIYLVDKDCVIDTQKEKIYTTNLPKYLLYILNLNEDTCLPLEKLWKKYEIRRVKNLYNKV